MNITLESIDAVRPSTYNPRSAVAERLDLIELSLRKLGFIAPIFADSDGEILSGHQRHLVASRMGATHVPVSRTKALDLDQRKALNIVFNRATNDFDFNSTPGRVTSELQSLDIEALAARIPDKQVGGDSFLRCLKPAEVAVKDLCKVNSGRWIQYARNLARTLHRHGILMPIVCREDLTVINGIGRLEMLAEKSAAFAPVVFVTDEEAEFARAMMNLLSMDFDIHTRYADMLRFNSFRRARRVRRELGNGFIFATHGAKPCKDFDIAKATDKARWVKEHGTTILDFGAGHLTETFLLRQAGIDCTPFEPYRLGPGGINKAESVELARAFLAEVAAGKEWTSIFIASVLNSVPFREDREYIACLCAALCKPFTKVYACASSAGESGWRQVNGKAFMNESNAGNIAFRLDYEPGIRIGDFQDKPKVQKYHTVSEFRDLFGPFFRSVKVDDFSNNINAACAAARPVDPARLRAAIEFEFNLPYPDGTRMDLVQCAMDSFQPTSSDYPMIILLDLNYTLVANSPKHGTTPERMEKRLANEQYRQWLVELVRPHTVVLITARPETWTIKTLDRIEQETGWRPQDACFAPKGWWNPPAIKEHLLKKDVFPIHGEDARYIAIESNPRTREMYARFSIPCFWVTEEGICLTEGTRIVKRLPRE